MLRKDKLYRGPNAVHVRSHPKLRGKHRTIVSFAIPTINTVLASRHVKEVRLGIIANIAGTAHSKKPGVRIVRNKGFLRYSIWNKRVLQVFQVFPNPGMEYFVECLLK